MRVNQSTSSSQANNVAAGIYPYFMNFDHNFREGVDNFSDTSVTQAYLKPTNFNDSNTRNAINTTIININSIFPVSETFTGASDVFRMKAGKWASYDRAKYLSVSPWGEIRYEFQNTLLRPFSNTQIKMTRLGTNRILLLWRVTSGDLYAVAGEISASGITWGSETQIGTLNAQNISSLAVIDNDEGKVVVYFRNTADANNIYCAAFMVTGTTIGAPGTAVLVDTNLIIDNVVHLAADKSMVAVYDAGGTTYRLFVVSTSGTACTVGAVSTINIGNNNPQMILSYLSDNTVLLLYAAGLEIVGRVATVSGTTIALNTAATLGVGTSSIALKNMAMLTPTLGAFGTIYPSFVTRSIAISGTTVTFPSGPLFSGVPINIYFDPNTSKLVFIDIQNRRLYTGSDVSGSLVLDAGGDIIYTRIQINDMMQQMGRVERAYLQNFFVHPSSVTTTYITLASVNRIKMEVSINGNVVATAASPTYAPIFPLDAALNSETIEISLKNLNALPAFYTPDELKVIVT